MWDMAETINPLPVSPRFCQSGGYRDAIARPVIKEYTDKAHLLIPNKWYDIKIRVEKRIQLTVSTASCSDLPVKRRGEMDISDSAHWKPHHLYRLSGKSLRRIKCNAFTQENTELKTVSDKSNDTL